MLKVPNMAGSLWARKIPAATKTTKATHMRRCWELFLQALDTKQQPVCYLLRWVACFWRGLFPPTNELSLVGIISQQFFFPFQCCHTHMAAVFVWSFLHAISQTEDKKAPTEYPFSFPNKNIMNDEALMTLVWQMHRFVKNFICSVQPLYYSTKGIWRLILLCVTTGSVFVIVSTLLREIAVWKQTNVNEHSNMQYNTTLIRSRDRCSTLIYAFLSHCLPERKIGIFTCGDSRQVK